MTSEDEGKIIRLCQRLDIPISREQDIDAVEHPWNGQVLRLAHPTRNRHGTSDFIHEIAHWLVAPEEARSDPYFGLESLFEYDEAVAQEVLASLLGILIERALGFDWRYTWEFHSWDVDRWLGVRPAIRELRKRGLIDGLRPTCLP